MQGKADSLGLDQRWQAGEPVILPSNRPERVVAGTH